jgi:uncharacterized protein YndB with AHSA1/START domain
VAEAGTVTIKQALRFATLAAAALALSVPAAAELTQTSDSGFVSRHEVVVDASPKQVWLALISPAGWWRSEHTWSGEAANLTLTPQAGGCFCETIPEVDEPDRFTLQGSVEHMRVIQAYPERALRMQGALGPLQSEPVIGILTIAISEAEEGTRIVWEYNVGGTMRFEVPVIAKAVDAVMGAQLGALAALLGPVTAPAADEAASAGQKSAEPAEPATDSSSDSESDAAPDAPPKDATAPKPEPEPKPASVDDAFGDLSSDPAV